MTDVKPEETEVLQPKQEEQSTAGVDLTVVSAQNLNMDRPEKVLELLEKYRPGTISELAEVVVEDTRKFKKSKFKFGERQAYLSLFWSLVTGATVMGCLIWTVINPSWMSFFIILALIPFFAVTQGQRTGFLTVLSGVADLFRSLGKYVSGKLEDKKP